MNVLFVCSGNKGIATFVVEQAESLRKQGIEVDIFSINEGGVIGYLKNYRRLKSVLSGNQYDLVHAHYGLSGLLANLQRKIPVFTTFHGSDLHIPSNRKFSKLAAHLSKHIILTNTSQKKHFKRLESGKYSVLPCGVDTNIFNPMDSQKAKQTFGFSEEQKYVLFASSLDRAVKNPQLAIAAVDQISNAQLVELKGYSREEVATLLNAVDIVLITSHNETGPLIAKEAWACNTPVLSTDVGDVSDILGAKLTELYIVSNNADTIAQRLNDLLQNPPNHDFREMVLDYSLQNIAKQLKHIYEQNLST